MARSSGGGGGGGSSRSSSSYSSSHGSGHWRDHSGGGNSIAGTKVKKHKFHGATRYSYRTRRGRKRYVYSDSDLTQCKDDNPLVRIGKVVFYLFVAAIISLYMSREIPKFETRTNDSVKIVDQIGCFTEEEEAKLIETMEIFKESTGINAKIYTTRLTVRFDIDEFTMDEYYRQYNHENGWVIVYAETKEKPIAWQWEGVQGENTVQTMGYFLSTFNKTVQKSLEDDNTNPDPYKAFDSAFKRATKMFDSQPEGFDMQVFCVWFGLFGTFAILYGKPWEIRFYGFKCKDLQEDPESNDYESNDEQESI